MIVRESGRLGRRIVVKMRLGNDVGVGRWGWVKCGRRVLVRMEVVGESERR